MQAKQKHRGNHAMYTSFCKRVQASEREMVHAFKTLQCRIPRSISVDS